MTVRAPSARACGGLGVAPQMDNASDPVSA
jgi:hypothetical protein